MKLSTLACSLAGAATLALVLPQPDATSVKTGKVESGQSQHVVYEGQPLGS